MASMNKVILIGRLGQEPELRTMQNGEGVCTLSIATSESWTDKQTGEKRETTEWHRVVLYRRLAEIAGQYLRKGHLISVEGKIKSRKWQDQDGIERTITEIIADGMKMLSKPENANTPTSQTKTAKSSQNKPILSESEQQDFNDDIPF